ncbi:MAG: hypothetical protein OXG90_08060 [Gammaproteobacteria bacterium]|nr:hypothetical protein [Gammaproteobacteria bacterium]MYA64274.1 hypothetical protein [Gemmatimonadota bacterium]MYH46326.1 hypothetical protein [Gammaproteobacteria bacterium]MYL13739.1 hypothetical protein [Gammaproteobacteria bacterium]
MKFVELAIALGVAVFVLVFTLAASFPMVAVYAYLIEPGHPPEFYTEAANWIAPWSSHILGPIAFFCCNYWLLKSGRVQFPMRFAASTIGFYLLVDLGLLGFLLNIPLSSYVTAAILLSLAVKVIAAFWGAKLGLAKRLAPA